MRPRGTRTLEGLLHGVAPLDAATFAAAALTVLLLAALAAWLPTRAAALVDPSEALRNP